MRRKTQTAVTMRVCPSPPNAYYPSNWKAAVYSTKLCSCAQLCGSTLNVVLYYLPERSPPSNDENKVIFRRWESYTFTVYALLTPKHEDRTVFENDRTNIQYGVLIRIPLRPFLLSPKKSHARFMISSLSRSEPKALSRRSTWDCLCVCRSNVNDPSFCSGR